MSGAKTETKDNSATIASTSNPPPSTAPSAVEAIEEDDEFEEFEPCQWNKNEEDTEDSQQWQVRIIAVVLESMISRVVHGIEKIKSAIWIDVNG